MWEEWIWEERSWEGRWSVAVQFFSAALSRAAEAQSSSESRVRLKRERGERPRLDAGERRCQRWCNVAVGHGGDSCAQYQRTVTGATSGGWDLRAPSYPKRARAGSCFRPESCQETTRRSPGKAFRWRIRAGHIRRAWECEEFRSRRGARRSRV